VKIFRIQIEMESEIHRLDDDDCSRLGSSGTLTCFRKGSAAVMQQLAQVID
jgi:hypothetical protein